jgi:hypothetical protein
LCYKFLIFSYTALFTLASSTKTLTSFYYLTKHVKTLKNSEAKARAILVLCLAKSDDQALYNYNVVTKQAPSLVTLALRAHKAPTPKINQNKKLLIVIIIIIIIISYAYQLNVIRNYSLLG